MHVPTPTWRSLPRELVVEICGHLETPQDRLNLVRCSKQFYKTFRPLLYRDICTGGQKLRPIVRVVDTLATNPTLAASVDTLHLSAWETYLGFDFAEFDDALDAWREDRRINGVDEQDEWSEDGSVRLSALDFGPLEAQAQRVTRSTDEADFWMDEIRMGNADAWIAMLLTLAPNLRRLEAEFPSGALWVHYLMRWAANGGFGSVPAFPSLAEIYVDWKSDETRVTDKHLMPIVLLPSLRRFYAKDLRGGVPGVQDQLPNSRESEGASAMTHVEIDGCDGEWDPGKVLAFCSELRSFKYNHRRCRAFDPCALYRALLPFRETIETLWLDVQERSRQHADGHHCDDPLPSLSDFTALKTLHLRMGNLPVFGPHSENHTPLSLAQALPSSIGTLQIVDTGNLSDLQTLARKVEYHVDHDLDSTPALTRIDFKPSVDSPQAAESREIMAKACARANITFHVCSIFGGPSIWGDAGFVPMPSLRKKKEEAFVF